MFKHQSAIKLGLDPNGVDPALTSAFGGMFRDEFAQRASNRHADRCEAGVPSTASVKPEQRLQDLCTTRADKLHVAALLLKELLDGQPSDVDWALTDPDGKVFAYITHAAEWQRGHAIRQGSRNLPVAPRMTRKFRRPRLSR